MTYIVVIDLTSAECYIHYLTWAFIIIPSTSTIQALSYSYGRYSNGVILVCSQTTNQKSCDLTSIIKGIGESKVAMNANPMG
jgi:hypothetical protein